MKVLNFGSCNIDYVYMLDHVVEPGETEATDKLSVFCGGKGLNQSIALARAGIHVYHAGCIGQDGEFLAELLKNSGADLTFLKRVNEKNGHAIIQVTATGENSIFIYSGSNAMISREDVDYTLSHFSAGDIVVLQNEISNVDYIVDQAYQKGMKVVFNPSPFNDAAKKIDLKKISYLIINKIEAKMITGEEDKNAALNCLKERYPNLAVILTLGSKGSVYQYGENRVYQASFEVETKDTTAAGDTFTGFFVAEIVKGSSIQTALEIASCASAIAVSRHGAAPSIPVLEEVNSLRKVMKVKQLDFPNTVGERIKRYVDEHVANIKLSDISKELGYSLVYTGTLIKKFTGLSYKEYLVDRRLTRAAELLKNTDKPIWEIIVEIGYENESYFRKKFVEKYGKKPLEYRKGI